MSKNPFGDAETPGPRRVNPFGEAGGEEAVAEAVNRLEHAARKIRMLRTQMGAEGLTLSATRELIDEVTGSFDAAARALRALGETSSGRGAGTQR
jgi:hypothetical protein